MYFLCKYNFSVLLIVNDSYRLTQSAKSGPNLQSLVAHNSICKYDIILQFGHIIPVT